MRKLRVYYATIGYERGNIEGQETIEAQEFPLRDAILTAEPTKHYNHYWLLANREEDPERKMIFGRLGHPDSEHLATLVLNEEGDSFEPDDFEVPSSISAAFAINYENGELAFEFDEIKPRGFVSHFTAILNRANEGKFSGELARSEETYRQFLDSVDKVTRVQFEVVPTNPRDDPIFHPLDAGMKVAGAKKMRTIIESDEGLNIDVPDSREEETENYATMGLEMNEAGYGKGYRIDATKNGMPTQFHVDSANSGSLISDVFEMVTGGAHESLELLRAEFIRKETGEIVELRQIQPPNPQMGFTDTARRMRTESPPVPPELESPKDDESDGD